MAKIEWDDIKPLKTGTEIADIEFKYQFVLPADLKKGIKECNGGIPFPYTFDMGKNVGMVFGGLLSVNKGDVDSFYDVVKRFETMDGKLKMFPFGVDPAGNFFCVENGEIVFYFSETEKTYFICKTYTELLDMLYK